MAREWCLPIGERATGRGVHDNTSLARRSASKKSSTCPIRSSCMWSSGARPCRMAGIGAAAPASPLSVTEDGERSCGGRGVPSAYSAPNAKGGRGSANGDVQGIVDHRHQTWWSGTLPPCHPRRKPRFQLQRLCRCWCQLQRHSHPGLHSHRWSRVPLLPQEGHPRLCARWTQCRRACR